MNENKAEQNKVAIDEDMMKDLLESYNRTNYQGQSDQSRFMNFGNMVDGVMNKYKDKFIIDKLDLICAEMNCNFIRFNSYNRFVTRTITERIHEIESKIDMMNKIDSNEINDKIDKISYSLNDIDAQIENLKTENLKLNERLNELENQKMMNLKDRNTILRCSTSERCGNQLSMCQNITNEFENLDSFTKRFISVGVLVLSMILIMTKNNNLTSTFISLCLLLSILNVIIYFRDSPFFTFKFVIINILSLGIIFTLFINNKNTFSIFTSLIFMSCILIFTTQFKPEVK